MTARGHLLPFLMLLVGLALVVRTLAGGGGPRATGLVLGILFCIVGAGRLWVETRGGDA
jgi:hypothetical protein